MSQIWTDNPYSANAVGQTDLQSIENNFAAIKSAWSGTTAPASPIAGMWWHDTTTNILKHYYDGGWESVYDLANGRVLAALDSVNCSRNVIAGTGLSGGGVLSADRTITHSPHTGDVTGSGALTIAAGAVHNSMLSTTYQEVSTPSGSSGVNLSFSSAGGYGFYPQIKKTSGAYTISAQISTSGSFSTSYVTNIWMGNSGSPNVATARMRYVTASGEVNWLYYFIDKKSGDIIANSIAPDHPCIGAGGKPKLLAHPFPDYDPKLHEIVVVNPSNALMKKIRAACYVDSDDIADRGIIDVINEDYSLVHDSPAWPDVPVTAAIRFDDWNDTNKVEIIKKVIPQADFIKTASLRRKK